MPRVVEQARAGLLLLVSAAAGRLGMDLGGVGRVEQGGVRRSRVMLIVLLALGVAFVVLLAFGLAKGRGLLMLRS